MRTPFCWLGLLVLGVLMAARMPGAAQATTSAEPSLVNPLDGPFLGFGAEWDGRGYLYAKFTEADWNLVQQRIQWMRLPLVRIMMQAGWCYTGEGGYQWDGEAMQILRRQLDFCEAQGIAVMLTDWGVNDNWMRIPGVQRMDDPKYAEIIGTYLDYLINEKKYTCLKYFIFVNEPGRPATRDEWLAGLANVAAELKKRGLDQRLRLTAPDQSGNRYDLLPATIEKLGPVLGAYDLHLYANQNKRYSTTAEAARSGDIRRHFTEAWKLARTMDPDRTKPLIIAEAGYWSEPPEVAKRADAATNSWHRDWRYGFFMAQYAIQAVEAGSWGVSAWMLDDTSHSNFSWGMWASKKEDFALKPWFYVWALLSRSFPPGVTFSLVTNTPPGIQILAAKLPSLEPKSGHERWSLCVVNTEKNEAKFTLRLPGVGVTETDGYLYSEKQATTDAKGLPQPSERRSMAWDKGELLSCPPESVLFFVPSVSNR